MWGRIIQTVATNTKNNIVNPWPNASPISVVCDIINLSPKNNKIIYVKKNNMNSIIGKIIR